MLELFDWFCFAITLMIVAIVCYSHGYIRGIECFSMECYHKGKGRTMKEVSDENRN